MRLQVKELTTLELLYRLKGQLAYLSDFRRNLNGKVYIGAIDRAITIIEGLNKGVEK